MAFEQPVPSTTRIIDNDLIILLEDLDINVLTKTPTVLGGHLYFKDQNIIAISMPLDSLASQDVTCTYDKEVDILNVYFGNPHGFASGRSSIQGYHVTLGWDETYDIVIDGFEDTKKIVYIEVMFFKHLR